MTLRYLMRRAATLGALVIVARCAVAAPRFDVVVYGGTPGGIAAAVEAARLGSTVALVESHGHLGGMSASGLGKSDVETHEAIGGLWQEFVARVLAHYQKVYGPGSENVRLCRDGYFYEPSVAESVFNDMVREQARISVFLNSRLDTTERRGDRLVAIHCVGTRSHDQREFRGHVFIDASYEGDMAACAGVDYRVGRESRSEFDELHAGVIYMDNRTRTLLAGTTGKGDKRVQAYTFRLCLSNDPKNRVDLTQPPPEYDRKRYLGYLDDLKEGRLAAAGPIDPKSSVYAPFYNTIGRVFTVAALPNHKFDANMYAIALGYPFAAENYDYPEADWRTRKQITEHLRNITLGLWYFAQHDPEVPEAQREMTRQFGLAKDEFVDNGNFPWQLYVREARRIVGEYTLTENDLIVGPELGRTPVHNDSIAAGEYPIDSMPVRKREPGHPALEGYIMMLKGYTNPYQIPYRIMVPKRVEGLLVPVAASATHIAFASIRLEPTWMALGQVAGMAAHQALEAGISPRHVDVRRLQRELLSEGQVITFFRDINRKDPAFAAAQYFGTKGFFHDYYLRSHDPVEIPTARKWLELALGSQGRTLGRLLPETGILNTRELAKLGLADRRSGSAGGGEPVTRGEFCRILYAAVR